VAGTAARQRGKGRAGAGDMGAAGDRARRVEIATRPALIADPEPAQPAAETGHHI